ncbi:hypothetical protein GGI15_002784 [Coemansia interrupta]|uniref:Uncharacterized protein n=1 Tax=Coemansia interrupta TaxID=1126814 RepID=A0A9W8LKI1_9FUNG|nr:hypothetical protein GGI15_002784 [Coemansia interrupta]
MPTLSTQVAYLLHLADTACSEHIHKWTSESLGELITWAQHADLILPTLSSTDRSAVLRHAAALHPLTSGTSHVHDLLQTPRPCLPDLLVRVIANPSTPDDVRVAAIHKAAEDIRDRGNGGGGGEAAVSLEIAERVAQTLVPLQCARRVAEINSVLAGSGIQGAQPPQESAAEAEYLMAPGTPRIISIALALMHAAESAATPSAIEQMAAGIFRHARAPEHYNALLFAALHTSCTALQYAITSRITSRFHTTLSSKTAQNESIRYFISLDARLLAKLTSRDDSFGRKYMAQLLWMNKCCQLAMLGEYIGQEDAADMLAGSDEVVAGLVDRWQKVYGLPGYRSKVVEAMRGDRVRFDELWNCPQAMVDNPAFQAIVDFWNALYEQFI